METAEEKKKRLYQRAIVKSTVVPQKAKYKIGKPVLGADGKPLLDKDGNPVYLPQAGTANLSFSPIDAIPLGLTASAPSLLRWIGANILGNAMAESVSQLPEGLVSGAGLLKTPISEDLKRTGGFNDFKQAKKSFKEGEIGKAAWNVLTGIGGVYDSKMLTPNWKYDDVVDKSIETLNALGDSYSGVKGLQELKTDKGTMPKDFNAKTWRINAKGNWTRVKTGK